MHAKKTKYLLPKKKPEEQIIDQPVLLEKKKESEKKKIITKIDDIELIIPRKKPITYQTKKEKIATESMYF